MSIEHGYAKFCATHGVVYTATTCMLCVDEAIPLPPVPDQVSAPAHYAGNGIEPITVIQTWGLGFCLGNVVKYIARAGIKTPDPLEDLRKARQYLDFEIQALEGKRGR